ncbi:hypothetical protein HB662_23175 [Roseomonas frigidaquae]|uniref:Cellulose biosynthesis protein BcsE n=1 Tax=Falsiroseomonas frigidaquae TaxID=487318 RepID=A0ABX1F630_9PROT|nr:hypothetical protein [Falsiroseomonas frigidaquae]NKE47699.1 hypothetical protein [Falsiroseomonas frigidaquae]
MVGPVGDELQLGLDCVVALRDGGRLLVGSARAPADAEATLWLEAPDGQPCPIAQIRFHPGAGPKPNDTAQPARNFTLLVRQLPVDTRLVLQSGEARVAIAAEGPGEAALARVLAAWPAAAGFALLSDCAADPALQPLLAWPQRPFGVFADWLGGLGTVRGRIVENLPEIEEAETLTSLAGEVMVVVRGSTPFPPEARLEALPLGLQPDASGRGEAVALPLLDWHVVALPQALVGHGRIDPAWLDRLSTLDLVLQLQPRPDLTRWLRCRPRAATVPDMLDAICRTTPFAEPTDASGAAALDLLRLVVARREGFLAPSLAMLAAQRAAPDAAGRLPRLGLILGADDPLAARLFQVTAPEFEGRCDRLLVMGDAAEAVAQPFIRRGRIPVAVGAAAVQALRDAAGRAGVLAVEAPRFAAFVAAGRPADAFSHPLGAADLARLLALHAAAGCEPALADSLARLLRLHRTRQGEPAFMPVQRGWSSPHAAEVVNDHLARLWCIGMAGTAANG